MVPAPGSCLEPVELLVAVQDVVGAVDVMDLHIQQRMLSPRPSRRQSLLPRLAQRDAVIFFDSLDIAGERDCPLHWVRVERELICCQRAL